MIISRRNKKTAFVLVAVAWIAVNMVWMGCVSAPLPSRKKPVIFRNKTAIDFVVNASSNSHLSQQEVISKLGQPDAYFKNQQIACYKIDSKTQRKVFLFLFLIPIDVYEYQQYDVALVEYDKNLISTRVAVVAQYDPGNFESTARLAVENWLMATKGR